VPPKTPIPQSATFRVLSIDANNPITRIITDPKLWDDLLKKYAELVLQGNIVLDGDGKVAKKQIGPADTKEYVTILTDTAKAAALRDPQISRIVSELGSLKDLGLGYVKTAWTNGDYTKLIVPVVTVCVAGIVIVGLADAIIGPEKTKDQAAAIATSMIPKNLYKVGEIQKSGTLSVTTSNVKWVPSQGTWQVTLGADYEKQLQALPNLKIGTHVEVTTQDAKHKVTFDGKMTATATYHLGTTYLDDLQAHGSLMPSGKYGVGIKAVKTIKMDDSRSLDLYIDLGHQGKFRNDQWTDPASNTVLFGFKFHFK
jgi:hypothetical protein